jgi:hypothetical protein
MRKPSLAAAFAVLAVLTAVLYRVAAPPTPEQALHAAFAQLHAARHVAGVASVAMLMPAKGPAAAREPLALRGAFRFDTPDDGAPSGEFTLRTPDGLTVDGRLVQGADLFVRATVPALAGAASAGPAAAAAVGDTWYKTDLSALGLLAGAPGAASAAGAAKAARGTDVAAAALAWGRLRDLAFSGELFVTDGTAAYETVDGVRAYRVALQVRREAAGAFAVALRAATLGRALASEESAAAAADAAAGSALVTAWVDPKAGRLLSVQIETGDAGAAAKDAAPARQVIRLDSLDYSMPANVKAPDSARPLDELLRGVLPGAAAKPEKK